MWASASQNPYADFTIYKYDPYIGECVTTDGEGNELSLSSVEMNRYDMFFEGRNRYASLLVKIDIYGGDILREGSINLELTRNTQLFAEPASPLSSSILRFSAFADSDMRDLADNQLFESFSEKYYDAVLSYPKDNSTVHSKCFATLEGDTLRKNDSIILSLDYTDADIVSTDGKELVRVYLFITYDPLLVEKVTSENGVAELDIENDLSTLNIGLFEKEA